MPFSNLHKIKPPEKKERANPEDERFIIRI